MSTLPDFVKNRRRQADLTQKELALKAGVGLRFIRDLEQGKSSLRMDKVNQVLGLFGHEIGAIRQQAAGRWAEDEGGENSASGPRE